MIFVPGPDTAREFRDALGRFTTGVTIVTCEGPDGPMGITANSFASVSLDPPLVLWSPARGSSRYPAFRDAEAFAIHVLGEDQRGIGAAFARHAHEAFGAEPPMREGVPVIEGCLARFVCARHAVFEAGDHDIVVGRVLLAQVREGGPLVFSGGRYGGFAPHH